MFIYLPLTAFHFLRIVRIPFMIPGTCYLWLAPGREFFQDNLQWRTNAPNVTIWNSLHGGYSSSPSSAWSWHATKYLTRGQCRATVCSKSRHSISRQQRYSVCVNCIHRSTKCFLATIAMDPGVEFSWRRSRYSAWMKTQWYFHAAAGLLKMKGTAKRREFWYLVKRFNHS